MVPGNQKHLQMLARSHLEIHKALIPCFDLFGDVCASIITGTNQIPALADLLPDKTPNKLLSIPEYSLKSSGCLAGGINIRCQMNQFFKEAHTGVPPASKVYLFI